MQSLVIQRVHRLYIYTSVGRSSVWSSGQKLGGEEEEEVVDHEMDSAAAAVAAEIDDGADRTRPSAQSRPHLSYVARAFVNGDDVMCSDF